MLYALRVVCPNSWENGLDMTLAGYPLLEKFNNLGVLVHCCIATSIHPLIPALKRPGLNTLRCYVLTP